MADENEMPAADAPVMETRGRKPAEKMLPVLLKKGYFPKDGGAKVDRGLVVELPISEAKAMIAAGIAERADALPE